MFTASGMSDPKLSKVQLKGAEGRVWLAVSLL